MAIGTGEAEVNDAEARVDRRPHPGYLIRISATPARLMPK
jgi:hypothetical protein